VHVDLASFEFVDTPGRGGNLRRKLLSLKSTSARKKDAEFQI
jgi:hypothetical protein